MGKIFQVGIGAIMAVFSIIVVVDFVAAVDKKFVPLKSNLHRITGRIRWNLSAVMAYGNTELNCILNWIHKCVETRGSASLWDDGIVQAHGNMGITDVRLADYCCHNHRHILPHDSRYRWSSSDTQGSRGNGQGRLILMRS